MSVEVTPRDIICVFFRQKAVILLTILTVCVATFIGLKLKTPIYEAQVKMLISAEKQMESPYYRDIGSDRNIEAVMTQGEIVKSNPVMERVVSALQLYRKPLDYEKRFASPLKRLLIDRRIKNMGMDRYTEEQQKSYFFRGALEDLKTHIKVEPIRGTNLFSLKVQDYNPLGAAILANVVSRSYVMFDLEQQLTELETKYTEKNLLVTQLKESIAAMEKTLDGKPLPTIEAIGPASVKIIEQATIPMKPVGLPEKVIAIVAGIMSVLLGVVLAFAFEYLDQSFRSKQDAEEYLHMPVLACINKKRGWNENALLQKKSLSSAKLPPRATSYKILAEQLHFIHKTRNIRSILVAPAAFDKGLGAVLVNISIFLSQKLGHTVLLIDANLRHPSLHKFFKIPKSPGLSEVIEGKISAEKGVYPAGTNMSLMPAGESILDPGILLDETIFKKTLGQFSKDYSFIIINCADLREYKDAAMISSSVDGVVLAVSEGGVRRQVVSHAILPLKEKQANMIGAIMSNRNFVIPKILYERI